MSEQLYDVRISLYDHHFSSILPDHRHDRANKAALDTPHKAVTMPVAIEKAEARAEDFRLHPIPGNWQECENGDKFRKYLDKSRPCYEGDKGSPRTLFIEIIHTYPEDAEVETPIATTREVKIEKLKHDANMLTDLLNSQPLPDVDDKKMTELRITDATSSVFSMLNILFDGDTEKAVRALEEMFDMFHFE